MRERGHYRYELRRGHKIVYFGITNNPQRRVSQHDNSEKNFTHMNILGPAVTKETAEQWEKQKLEQYRRNHYGDNPKYNKR